MNVNVPILVLEKSVVEVGRSKAAPERVCCDREVGQQGHPFLLGEAGRMLFVPTKSEKALSEKVLVVVEDKTPVSRLTDKWR